MKRLTRDQIAQRVARLHGLCIAFANRDDGRSGLTVRIYRCGEP